MSVPLIAVSFGHTRLWPEDATDVITFPNQSMSLPVDSYAILVVGAMSPVAYTADPQVEGCGVDWELRRTFARGNFPINFDDVLGSIHLDPVYRFLHLFAGYVTDDTEDTLTFTFPNDIYGMGYWLGLAAEGDEGAFFTYENVFINPVEHITVTLDGGISRLRRPDLVVVEGETYPDALTPPLAAVVQFALQIGTDDGDPFSGLDDDVWDNDQSFGFFSMRNAQDNEFSFGGTTTGELHYHASGLFIADSLDVQFREEMKFAQSLDERDVRVLWRVTEEPMPHEVLFGLMFGRVRQPSLRRKQRDDEAPRAVRRNAPTSSQAGGRASLRNRYH